MGNCLGKNGAPEAEMREIRNSVNGRLKGHDEQVRCSDGRHVAYSARRRRACVQIKRLEDKLAAELHAVRVEAAAFSTRALEVESAQHKRAAALSALVDETVEAHVARLERLERLASDAAAAARPSVRPVAVSCP
jgi:hypothetical protein